MKDSRAKRQAFCAKEGAGARLTVTGDSRAQIDDITHRMAPTNLGDMDDC
jgi:hypothetical protein